MTEPAFVPIEPNPYIVGNPVRNPKMFFGREVEFQTVRRDFVESSGGLVFVFCGERRSGKTSILFQIRDGRLGKGFVPVLIDMQAMVIETEADFFTLITDEILRTLGGAAEQPSRPSYDVAKPSAAFRKFIERLHPLLGERKLVLLIDEYELMEDKVREGRLSEDVFHMFAHLTDHSHVFFVFTGSQHLEQRGNQIWRILAKSRHKRISYLERRDAETLITTPVEGRVRFADGTVGSIFRLGAGHPFYTQWICQNLIDHLNEHQTNTADPGALAGATEVLIDNPPPEMTRLWSDLTREQKLTLALLAEVLDDADGFASPEKLAKFAARKYHVQDIDLPRIAGAGEELLKQEFLLRNPRDVKGGYAFRMDLWRSWIRHSHSVWQVIHEEGFRVRRAVPVPARIGFAVVALASAWAAYTWIPRGVTVPSPPPSRFASIRLEVEPRDAAIYRNGVYSSNGIFMGDRLEPDAPHEFRVTAAGYHDSTFAIQLAADEARDVHVALRPQLGSLHIRTTPPGAALTLDGQPRGTTPSTIERLPVRDAELRVSLAGHDDQSRTVRVVADSTVTVAFDLTRRQFRVLVSTTPPGAELSIDGNVLPQRSPASASLTAGAHRITARLEGYVTVDSAFTAADESPLMLALKAVPPGYLVAQGERIARFHFDGVFRMEGTQNSGRHALPPGSHEVKVALSDTTIVRTVEVRSGLLTRFDFSDGTITFEPVPGD